MIITRSIMIICCLYAWRKEQLALETSGEEISLMATVGLNFWLQHFCVNFQQDESRMWEAGCCLHRADSPLLWASGSRDAPAPLSSSQENLPSPSKSTSRSFSHFILGWFRKFLCCFGGGLLNPGFVSPAGQVMIAVLFHITCCGTPG